MDQGIVVGGFTGRSHGRHRLWRTTLLAACLALTSLVGVHAESRGSRNASRGAAHAETADQLSMQVTDDRMTLAVTDVPQVYLFGVIDADAPQRFSALMQSGKIPRGSDVYLNSSSGNLGAGIALGRLFRSGAMVTHLGKPRRKGESNTAVCVGACTYAYFGGLYRWAPTGSDRIGLYPAMAAQPNGAGQAQPSNEDIFGYLKDMGINPALLTPAPGASRDAAIWLGADQMTSAGLANNGRLPLTVKFQPSSGAPYLLLEQTDRHGAHQISIECKPGLITLTAINHVGSERARQIVARGARTYFEINRREVLTQPRDGASVVNDAISITRPYPPARLEFVIFGQSIGAWVSDSNSAFRSGFTFDLEPVRATLKNYFNACWQYAPWPVSPQTQ